MLRGARVSVNVVYTFSNGSNTRTACIQLCTVVRTLYLCTSKQRGLLNTVGETTDDGLAEATFFHSQFVVTVDGGDGQQD